MGHDTLHTQLTSDKHRSAIVRHRTAIEAVQALGPVTVATVHLARMWLDSLRRNHVMLSLVMAPLDDLLTLSAFARVALLGLTAALVAVCTAVGVDADINNAWGATAVAMLSAVVTLPLVATLRSLFRWYAFSHACDAPNWLFTADCGVSPLFCLSSVRTLTFRCDD